MKNHITKLGLCAIICFTSATLAAQEKKDYSRDTDSIHHICDVSLEIISVKKGEPVNWDRFMNLFLPEGVMIKTETIGDSSIYRTIPVTRLKGYDGYTEHGFSEKVLKRITHQFGQVATVFESYEATTPDGIYHSRGVNIYQLIFKQGRWWIASISWCDETEKLKLPIEME